MFSGFVITRRKLVTESKTIFRPIENFPLEIGKSWNLTDPAAVQGHLYSRAVFFFILFFFLKEVCQSILKFLETAGWIAVKLVIYLPSECFRITL